MESDKLVKVKVLRPVSIASGAGRKNHNGDGGLPQEVVARERGEVVDIAVGMADGLVRNKYVEFISPSDLDGYVAREEIRSSNVCTMTDREYRRWTVSHTNDAA
jgi:hypothetical protein